AEQAGAGRDAGVAKNRHARHARRDLLEQLQPFRPDTVFVHEKASRIAARPRQTLDITGGNGSPTPANTVGTVRVASSNGARATLEEARMTSGASATSSAAYLRMVSGLPSPQR